MKKYDLQFTKTELRQLFSYLEERDRTDWYYGNKFQFENRHNRIMIRIASLLDEIETKNY